LIGHRFRQSAPQARHLLNTRGVPQLRGTWRPPRLPYLSEAAMSRLEPPVRRLKWAPLISAGLLIGAAAARAADADERPTQSFRREHLEVRTHLGHARQWVGELAQHKQGQQRAKAQQVVTFFEKHIAPHAQWEERVLYPLVDRLAGGGKHRFTETMRYEHRIVGRWIDELAKELAKPRPDFKAFARRADQLLGLVDAHFEEEEEVLLPLIDQSMTRAQFEKEVAEGGGH
jgi:hemerythrin-like domain-containing protein